MKIIAFNNIWQSCPILSVDESQNKNKNLMQHNVSGDVVSFSSKKYNANDIVNPTGHCAYCGCKVYTESQIDALAKEMLNLKADRLEGKIKSIIEKLEGAKHAEDISLAKRLENKEEIEFYTNLLNISRKKSFFKCDAVLKDVYGLDKNQSMEILVKNMHPLQKTIDHVSPQREDKENKNSDVNLVEACYCCNHDLKKGSTFDEFYIMFPSIKNNMPKEKFDYAHSNILESSNQISRRLSASNVMKLIDRLFIQRRETSDYLDTIDFRIRESKSDIVNAINSSKNEISAKEAEINNLQMKFDALKQDPEFSALIERQRIESKLEYSNGALSSLRERWQKTSDSINELRNPKQTKKYEQLSEEEKKKKSDDFMLSLKFLQNQIDSQNESCLHLKAQLEELDKNFPSSENLQSQKNEAEVIYNSHIALNKAQKELEQKIEENSQLSDKEDELTAQIADLAKKFSNDTDFDPRMYSDEQQSVFSRYNELSEALSYLNKHSNGGNIKILINQAAKLQIESELSDLQNENIIIDFNNYSCMEDLKLQLEKIQEEKDEVKKTIGKIRQECLFYKSKTSSVSMPEAQLKIKQLNESIKRINEKQRYTGIPQQISTLKSEIILLTQTINDLETKQNEIDVFYSENT